MIEWNMCYISHGKSKMGLRMIPFTITGATVVFGDPIHDVQWHCRVKEVGLFGELFLCSPLERLPWLMAFEWAVLVAGFMIWYLSRLGHIRYVYFVYPNHIEELYIYICIMIYLDKSLLWLSHEQWLLNPGWWLVRGLYYPLYQGSSYPTSVMEWPLIIRGASTQGPHPLVSRPMTSSDGESRSKLTSSISFWNGHAQKSLGLSIDPEICVNDRCLMKSTAEKLLYPHRHWICVHVSLLVKYVDYPHDQMGTTFLRDSSFQGNPAIFFFQMVCYG